MDANELRRVKEDYRRTFVASKHGVRVLEDLLRFCGVFDPCKDSKAEGRREVGLMILQALDKNTYRGLLELEKQGVGITEIGDEHG